MNSVSIIQFLRRMAALFATSSFIRNLSVLAAGASISQLIPLIASPVLTRFYSESDFGYYSNFIAIATFVSIFANGQYDFPVLLARNERDSLGLLKLTLSLSIVIAFFFCFSAFFLDKFYRLPFDDFNYIFCIFLLLSIFLSCRISSLQYWMHRHKRSKYLSISQILQSSLTAISSIALSIFIPFYGLIAGTIIGQSIAFLFLNKSASLGRFKMTKSRFLFLAKKYSRFPKSNIPIAIVNSTYNNSLFFIFSFVFPMSTVGSLYLTYRVVRAPFALISNPISDALLQKLSENNGHPTASSYRLIVRSFLSLSLIIFLPFLTIGIFGPNIFTFVFGELWSNSGRFASILAMGFFFEVSIAPFSRILYIINKNHLYFQWEVFRALILFGPLFSLHYFFPDINANLLLCSISISTVFAYLVLLAIILYSYQRALINERY